MADWLWRVLNAPRSPRWMAVFNAVLILALIAALMCLYALMAADDHG